MTDVASAAAAVAQDWASITASVAQTDVSVAAAFAQAVSNDAAAKTAAAQSLQGAFAAAAADHGSALAALARSLSDTQSQLTTAIAAATAARQTALSGVAADKAGWATARANEITAVNARMGELSVGNDRTAYWQATVQAKIDQTLDYIQLSLAIIGLVPVVGSVASAVDLFINLWRGKYLSAIGSVIGIIPGLGSLSNGVKLTWLGASVAARIARVTAAISRTAAFLKAGSRAAAVLLAQKAASVLGKVVGAYNFLKCTIFGACFIEGTPVVIGEDWIDDLATTVAPIPVDVEEEWDLEALLAAAAALSLTLEHYRRLLRRKPDDADEIDPFALAVEEDFDFHGAFLKA
jgi:hypothetical protein